MHRRYLFMDAGPEYFSCSYHSPCCYDAPFHVLDGGQSDQRWASENRKTGGWKQLKDSMDCATDDLGAEHRHRADITAATSQRVAA